MPTPQRRQPTAVVERLLAEPHRFEFFQAVRVLERWLVREEHLAADAIFSVRLQFRNSLSLTFPASEIAEFTVVPVDRDDGNEVDADVAADVEIAAKDSGDEHHASGETGGTAVATRRLRSQDIRHIEMTPAFIGLLGAGGALPIFYTELFAQRELYQRDASARAFMDIFQHRTVVLFYQAWRKHRLAVQFEADRRNRFLPLVLAIAGVGQEPLRDRLQAPRGGVSDDTLAFFAGALQQRPLSAAMIERVLARYFDVAIRLEQFVGRWFALPVENQTSLGLANATLGHGAVASQRVWQRDLRMRLTVGPMRRARFRRFLPGGAAALALRELLTLFTGVVIEYEVRLALLAEDVAPPQLGEASAPLLGWDSFLVTEPAEADRTDAGYDIHAIA